MSAGIALRIDLGIGHTRIFLNALSFFSTDGERKLLAQRHFHCCFYSDFAVREESVKLLTDAILSQFDVTERAHNHANARLLAARCVDEVFNSNQLEVLRQNLSGLPGG